MHDVQVPSPWTLSCNFSYIWKVVASSWEFSLDVILVTACGNFLEFNENLYQYCRVISRLGNPPSLLQWSGWNIEALKSEIYYQHRTRWRTGLDHRECLGEKMVGFSYNSVRKMELLRGIWEHKLWWCSCTWSYNWRIEETKSHREWRQCAS